MVIEDGTHSGSQNVVGKFILHTVQNLQNQESIWKKVGLSAFPISSYLPKNFW